MTERHQLIIESAKRDRIQAMVSGSGADQQSRLEKVAEEVRERDLKALMESGTTEQKSFLQVGEKKENTDGGLNERNAYGDTYNQYKRELKPMVYPNKHMYSPIKSEMNSKHSGGEAFESNYGKEL